MDETELNIREEIIRTGIRMNELDINQGTSGNISVRWKEGGGSPDSNGDPL